MRRVLNDRVTKKIIPPIVTIVRIKQRESITKMLLPPAARNTGIAPSHGERAIMAERLMIVPFSGGAALGPSLVPGCKRYNIIKITPRRIRIAMPARSSSPGSIIWYPIKMIIIPNRMVEVTCRAPAAHVTHSVLPSPHLLACPTSTNGSQ